MRDVTIRFKCQHCQKGLGVPDHLAGKRAACPVCKKPITIPTAPPTPPPETAPVDVEAAAAEALADKPPEPTPEQVSNKTIDFECAFCGEALKLPFELGGKMTPCPECKKIIKVPAPKVEKPKDWRDKQTTGPSMALSSQQEQLDDAWGTEQKGKVSREAMEEAGALPETAQPLGVTGWIRRGIWTAVVVGVVFLLFSVGRNAAITKAEKTHLAKVQEALPKLDALHKAEVFRAEGEIAVGNRRSEDAKKRFIAARGAVPVVGPKDELATIYEHDLFLIRLALSQIEMGGSGKDVLQENKNRPRIDWKDGTVQKEIQQTLKAIYKVDAVKSALRDLTTRLIEKEKLEVAAEILAGQAGERPPVKAQFVGLLLKRGDDKAAEALLQPPDLKFVADSLARVAYTEGNARNGKYGAAHDIAIAKGALPGPRLEACVAGAVIALTDSKSKDGAKEALLFITSAVEIYTKEVAKDSKEKVPWPVLELIRVAGRTEARDAIKDLAAKLPPPFRPRAQLDLYVADLEKPPAANATVIDDIGEDKCPLRCFGWEAFARYHARQGHSGNVRFDPETEAYWPFLHLGLALGEQERNKN